MVVAAALLFVVGMAGFTIVGHLRSDAAQIVGDTLPGLVYAGEIDSELSENFARTLLAINARSSDERAIYLKKIAEGSERVDESMRGYQSGILEEYDRQLFNHMGAMRQKYRDIRSQVFGLLNENKRDEALRLFETELLPAYTGQREAGQMLFKYNVRQGETRGVRIEKTCRITQWTVTVICVLVFVGGFFTPFFAIRLPPDILR
jgi:hypothetical protein